MALGLDKIKSSKREIRFRQISQSQLVQAAACQPGPVIEMCAMWPVRLSPVAWAAWALLGEAVRNPFSARYFV